MREGSPCQDAYRHTELGAALVLAVSDGAGSRRRSAEGAALAVTLATDTFAAVLSQPDNFADGHALKESLTDGYARIRKDFLRLVGGLAGEEHIGEFAATLLVAVVTGALTGVLQIGDGFAALRTDSTQAASRYHLLPQPGFGGEYVNETVFLTSAAGANPFITCVVDPGVTGIMLSTDGLMQPALTWGPGGPTGMNPSFAGAVLSHLDDPDRDPRLVIGTMLSDDVVKRTGDDMTLLAAVYR
ncbi:MAG TPA: PP2C family serine/threonine-protein phosphatase [Streptosporangiaceae bacterium]|nr:PP2C family serine/threonine-protein phosphatase [Streptosporangiaceae bacterium]